MKAVIIAAGIGDRLKLAAKDRPKPLVRLLGLPLILRAILSAREARIKEFVIVIGYHGDMIRDELGDGSKYGVRVEYVENNEWERGNGLSLMKARDNVAGRFILFMADHIFDPGVLKDVLNIEINDDEVLLVIDRAPKEEYIDISDATKVLLDGKNIRNIDKGLQDYNAVDCGIFLCSSVVFDVIQESIGEGKEALTDGMRKLAEKGRLKALDISGRFWIDIDTEEALKGAEKVIFKGLKKESDGLVSRLLNRPISIRITKHLVKTDITPNTISLVSFSFCLISAFSLSIGNYLSTIIGGLMVQFSSIFDGCDGEVARLKYQTSDYGAWFDSVLDRYADAAIILGMIYGLWHLERNNLIWLIGYLALIGSFLTSYTATKYDSVIRSRHKGSLWRFGRDTRLLLIMIGAVLNEIHYLLMTIAIITNIVSVRRLLVLRNP